MKKTLFVVFMAVALMGLAPMAFANCGACPSDKAQTCSVDGTCKADPAKVDACKADPAKAEGCKGCKKGKVCKGCKAMKPCNKKPANAIVTDDYTKGRVQEAGEMEKTGVVEVTFYGFYKKIDKVMLNTGNETIKLIHSAKHSMRNVEKMNGKTVTVRGNMRPADKKHPEVAFEVITITEKN